MKFYDYDEIKATGDCRRYCTDILGLQAQSKPNGENVSFNNPWRPGSDSGAFSVCRDAFYDHVSQEKGSILDLAATARHAGNMLEAQESLGEWLGLKPKDQHQAKVRKKFVCAYDYRDAAGDLVMQVVRWEPKHFSQRRPNPESCGIENDEWLWNIEGVPDLIYRLPEIAASPRAVIVGGEKDADNLAALGFPATTNPGGEGHWKPEHGAFLAGKDVVVMPDQDDAGARHCMAVVATLRGVAKRVRVAILPKVEGKRIKDVSDWISAGATRDMIAALLKDAKEPEKVAAVRPVAGGELLEITPDKVERAKQANKVPFSNYVVLPPPPPDEGGKRNKKPIKEPRKIEDMINEVFTRFLGFPRRLGSTLFDHDRDTGRIRLLENQSSLLAWIAEKSGHPVAWTRSIEGAISTEQLFEAITAKASEYSLISGVPTWPARSDVYYTHDKLPMPDPDAKKFNELCGFFSPASEADRLLIRAFMASPCFFVPRVDRPMWVIDAEQGQGTGKTKLVEFLAYLYGDEDGDSGTPIMVDHDQLNNETQSDRIHRRLLSQSGRRKRIMLIDNVDGFYRSSALSTLVTQATVSGMAPYGRGEESRAMDLTIAITSNSATMHTDIIDRSFFITLAKPTTPLPHWSTAVGTFIRKNRLQIISDIIGILQRGASYDYDPQSRFRDWERSVLAPMLGTMDAHSMVFKANAEKRNASDGDAEDAAIIWSCFRDKLAALGLDPDIERPIFITSQVAAQWAKAAIDGFGGRSSHNAARIIRNMVKTGKIPDLATKPEAFPARGSERRKGFMMHVDAYNDGRPVEFIHVTSEGSVKARVIE